MDAYFCPLHSRLDNTASTGSVAENAASHFHSFLAVVPREGSTIRCRLRYVLLCLSFHGLG